MVQKMRKMKDSGIEWIGEIPEGWEIGQIGQLYSERRTKVSDKDYPPLSVTMKGILPQLSTAAKTDAHDDRKLVCKGDFAINSRSDRRGSCGISEQDGSISLINTVLQPRGEMNPGYYNWLFHTSMFADEFYKWGHGIVDDLWTTGWSDMKKIGVPVPSKCEQKQLAEHLNVECSHIDSILSKTRASIEEYKKLKQAIITQAVTKGVRGEREMKDSGVEWIGEIPVDWEISRIKYVSIFEPSCDFRKLTPETVITYSPMECIKNGTFERRTSLYGNLAHTLTPFQNGDIVMAKVTPCFENGNIAIMNELQSGYGLGSSELFVFRPQNINTRYLFYWLQNKLFVHQACATMTGTGGLKRISPSFVKNCNIHYPSTAEQAQIAAYLDTKCAEIDGLIAKKEQLVKELEGYKKSLIYEVVTGKREV
jgi:type I restriction enzyme S subunit